jgi:hypothetical protein
MTSKGSVPLLCSSPSRFGASSILPFLLAVWLLCCAAPLVIGSDRLLLGSGCCSVECSVGLFLRRFLFLFLVLWFRDALLCLVS